MKMGMKTRLRLGSFQHKMEMLQHQTNPSCLRKQNLTTKDVHTLILDEFDPIIVSLDHGQINLGITQFDGKIYNYTLSENEGKSLYKFSNPAIHQ